MTLDRTRWCELLVGLERVEVLDVVRLLERLVVTVESTERLMGCSACGTRATVKDRTEWNWPISLPSDAQSP